MNDTEKKILGPMTKDVTNRDRDLVDILPAGLSIIEMAAKRVSQLPEESQLSTKSGSNDVSNKLSEICVMGSALLQAVKKATTRTKPKSLRRSKHIFRRRQTVTNVSTTSPYGTSK